jgi:hypothetical protein
MVDNMVMPDSAQRIFSTDHAGNVNFGMIFALSLSLSLSLSLNNLILLAFLHSRQGFAPGREEGKNRFDLCARPCRPPAAGPFRRFRRRS